MSDVEMPARATGLLVGIIDRIEPEQGDHMTPCAEFDVRRLAHHMLFWGPSLEGAARKEFVPPPAAAESEVDLPGGDWIAALRAQVERTGAAWGELGAWDGVTHMGGPTELPASLVGGMVVTEFLVHGWDFARATGQEPVWDAELVEYVHGEVVKTAEQGRVMGVYGPEVAVPESASTLDRLLGLTGRDPNRVQVR